MPVRTVLKYLEQKYSENRNIAKNTTIAQLISDHRNATEMTISATTVRYLVFTVKDSVQDDLLCVSLLIDDTEVLRWARDHFTWTRQQIGFFTLNK